MSAKYLIIILLLLIIIYMYNKNNTLEHLENTTNLQEFVDNISQVSKSLKDGKLTVDNLEVKKELTAPNLKTYQIGSTHKDKWIDFKGKTVFYEDAKFYDDKHNFTAPNITTRVLRSTKTNGDYINFDTSIFSPNDNLLGTIKSGYEPSKRSKVIVDTNIEYNKSKSLDLPDTVKFKGKEIKQNSGLMVGKKNWIGY